jgi:hypothetical protein
LVSTEQRGVKRNREEKTKGAIREIFSCAVRYHPFFKKATPPFTNSDKY